MITSQSPLQQHREADPAEGMGTKAQKVTKLLILGDALVGKTSIVMKFCDDTGIEGLKNLKPTVGGLTLYSRCRSCSARPAS